MRPVHVTTVLCVGTLLLACGKSDRPVPQPEPRAPAPSASPAPDAPPDAPSEAKAAPTAEELPIQEDFEQEAETRVTADNYSSELDAIEKALEAEEADGEQ